MHWFYASYNHLTSVLWKPNTTSRSLEEMRVLLHSHDSILKCLPKVCSPRFQRQSKLLQRADVWHESVLWASQDDKSLRERESWFLSLSTSSKSGRYLGFLKIRLHPWLVLAPPDHWSDWFCPGLEWIYFNQPLRIYAGWVLQTFWTFKELDCVVILESSP